MKIFIKKILMIFILFLCLILLIGTSSFINVEEVKTIKIKNSKSIVVKLTQVTEPILQVPETVFVSTPESSVLANSVVNIDPIPVPEPITLEMQTEKLFKKYFPEEDFEETVTILCYVLHAESKGVKSITNKAAVIWCACNRVDAGGEFKKDNTLIKTVRRNSQFALDNEYTEKEKEIVIDVLNRWFREKEGKTDVGRVLPKSYLWFTGDGTWNRFRKVYNSNKRFVPKHSEVYED